MSPLYSMITEAVANSRTGSPAGLRSSLPSIATISISAATTLPAVSVTFAFPVVLPISDRASGNCGKNGVSAASLKSSTLTSSRISFDPASPIAATLIRPPVPLSRRRRPSKLATKVPSAAIITSSSTSPKLSGAMAGSSRRTVKLEESTRSCRGRAIAVPLFPCGVAKAARRPTGEAAAPSSPSVKSSSAPENPTSEGAR